MKKLKSDYSKTKLPDVRILPQREPKMNTRKGIYRRKLDGFVDLTPYKEQLIFKHQQKNDHGYEIV